MKEKNAVEQLIDFQARTKIKWSVLSSVLGVNKYTLSRWVNGKNHPQQVYEKIILKLVQKSR